MLEAKGSDPLALAGIKVVELGTLIAGPFASSLLAQFWRRGGEG